MIRVFTKSFAWAAAGFLAMAASVVVAQTNMVSYVGGAGNQKFNQMLRLSDGSVLVAGSATNMNWVPSSVPINTLTIPQVPSQSYSVIIGMNSFDSTNIGFVARFTKGLDTVLNVVRFPFGTVGEVQKIRTNTVPGSTTGGIWISGPRTKTKGPGGNIGNPTAAGYYIAKLNGNFLTGVPSAVASFIDISAAPRRHNGSSNIANLFPAGDPSVPFLFQPWDVRNDERVMLVSGRDFSDDFSELEIWKADMSVKDTMGGLPTQRVLVDTGGPAPAQVEFRAPLRFIRRDSIVVQRRGASTVPIRKLYRVVGYANSGIVLKINRGGSNLRSLTQTDYDFTTTDENGRPGRKGANPDDIIYAGPYYADSLYTLNNPARQPFGATNAGYTGMLAQVNGNNVANQQVFDLVIDKRNNDFYYGAGTWVQFRNVPGTAEVSLQRMDANGNLIWWRRLHREDTANSPSVKMVKDIELDYANNSLVVLGQTIGTDTNGFWKGENLTNNPGVVGYQKEFSGGVTQDKSISWLAKYTINTGVITNATYVGELAQDINVGTPSANPLYGGYPDLNQNPQFLNLANTEVRSVSILPNGSIAVLATTEGRAMTTINGFMRNFPADQAAPNDSLAPIGGHFVRIYNPALTEVTYSSLLTPLWNPSNGLEGMDHVLQSILPTEDGNGVLVTGFRNYNPAQHKIIGNALPVVNVPSIGQTFPNAGEAIVARLYGNTGIRPGKVSAILGPNSFCQGSEATYRISPLVPNATSYAWGTPVNYVGSSTADTLLVKAGAGSGGILRAAAVNATGVGPIETKILPAPSATGQPANITLPSSPSQCAGSTRTYRVVRAPGDTTRAYQFIWKLPAGYSFAAPFLPTDSVTTADTVNITIAAGTTTGGQLTVKAVGFCGKSLAFARNAPAPLQTPARPAALVAAGGGGARCAGVSFNVSVNPPVPGVTYDWTVPTGWSITFGNATRSQVTVTPSRSTTNQSISAVATNGCGSSIAQTVSIIPVDSQATVLEATITYDPTSTPPAVIYRVLNPKPGATYTWFVNNTNSGTGTSFDVNTVTPNQNRNVYVRVQSACGTVNGPSVQVLNTITALNNQELRTYPNPVQDILTLDMEHSYTGQVNYRIIDALGRVVSANSFNKEAFSVKQGISVSALASGVYTIEVVHGNYKTMRAIKVD